MFFVTPSICTVLHQRPGFPSPSGKGSPQLYRFQQRSCAEAALSRAEGDAEITRIMPNGLPILPDIAPATPQIARVAREIPHVPRVGGRETLFLSRHSRILQHHPETQR